VEPRTRPELGQTVAAPSPTSFAMPFVYLLRCSDGSLYAGATVDLERRLAAHQEGSASRYTRSRRPVQLVWSLEVASWGEALSREAKLKRLRRPDKERLLAQAAAHAPPLCGSVLPGTRS
jgi:putative endonuclease